MQGMFDGSSSRKEPRRGKEKRATYPQHMGPPLPPNPCLVAIILIINAKSGPRFVFHYPAHPRDDFSATKGISKGEHGDSRKDRNRHTSSGLGEWMSSDDDVNDRDDEGTRRGGKRKKIRKRHRGGPNDEEDSCGDEKRSGSKGAAWETVFGFSTDGLEKILSPARSCHKKKFELGLEPLTYLSCPIFIREDGHWRKRKRERKKTTAVVDENDIQDINETDARNFASIDDVVDDLIHENVDGDDYVQEKDGTKDDDDEEDGKSTTSEDDRRAMSMFNMVFVMNPPVLEHNIRIKEMFEYVVRKFAKALKYEQARSNWVWRQSEMILSMKERAKEEGQSMNTLWHQILSKSSLAKAMSEVYHSISTSKIAHVFINNTFDISLQIPQVTSISELPTATEPQMPGTWLTTASGIEDDESLDSNMLAKHFALLLLDDVDNILKDIDHEHGSRDVSHPLAEFVQIVKPTMSFLQISQTHSLSLRRIQVLSRHLIYWRRAIAIPPLHQRDKYIVSPNAAMSQLPRATKAYAAKFPSLPSLPKLLSMLSGHPRAYSTLIPSKDHRDAYLDILAWLMKGGWVTQLRVFGWVRVTSDIKALVLGRRNDDGFPSDGKRPDQQEMKPTTTTTTTTTTLLLDPHKANALESRWLDAIAESLDDAEVREIWPRLVRYFNGQHALEKIPVREGFKRKDVWRWLTYLESRRVLVVVRHW